MFEYIQKHQKIIQVLLALLIVPFAFSGIADVASDRAGADTVAKVGSYQITQSMFDREFQNYKTRMSQQLGDQYNEAQFDSFESRQEYLNQMVDRAVLAEAAKKEHLSVSDSILQQALLAQVPKDGKGNVDMAQYEALVRAQGMSTAQYEADVRNQISASVVVQAASSGNDVLPLTQDYLQKMFSKVQVVEQKNIDPAPFLAGISVTPAQVKQYYDQHTAEFTRPAAFDLEYAVIPVLPVNYVPTDDEIKAAFGGNATVQEIASVRQDPVKLKEATQKTAVNKMESVAKKIIEASTATPKDLNAIVAKFGGKIETTLGVMRKGSENLPAPLKSPDVRDALTSSEMAASNAVSVPVAYDTNLVVGRVIKSNVAGLQPLETVQTEIENKLKQQAVIVKMREEADKQITSMNPAASIGGQVPMGPLLKRTMSPQALAQVMAVKEYPKFVVSQNDRGVSIVRVVSSAPPVSADQAELKQQISGWQGLAIELQRRAFMQSLRQRYDVKLFTEKLGGSDNPVAKPKV